MEKESYVGIGFILFGIFVGGVGVATAGFGIGIPMIPIGIYLVWRGFARKKIENEREDPFAVEKSSGGKVGLGIILILVGLATSALIIGIPILLYGIYMIYAAVKPELQEGASFEYQCAERIRENTKRYANDDISAEDALSLLREIITILNRENTNSDSPRLIGITEARQMAVMIHHQSVSMALDADYEEIARSVLEAYERAKTSNPEVIISAKPE
jgi:hypothetical protein